MHIVHDLSSNPTITYPTDRIQSLPTASQLTRTLWQSFLDTCNDDALEGAMVRMPGMVLFDEGRTFLWVYE